MLIPETICVDLDGTLINYDMGKWGRSQLRKEPWLEQLHIIKNIIHGYSSLKEALAIKYPLTQIDQKDIFHYHHLLIDWLQEKKAAGHRLVLASASHESYVKAIYDDLLFFDAYHGSTQKTHLIGRTKGQFLADTYGHQNFVYCGNSIIDLGVWLYASHAVTVNLSSKALPLLSLYCPVIKIFT